MTEQASAPHQPSQVPPTATQSPTSALGRHPHP